MSVSTVTESLLTPVSPKVPPYLLNTDHRERCLAQLRSKSTGLEKYIYLSGLKKRDSNLFYDVLVGNMLEIIPILYTPTVLLVSSITFVCLTPRLLQVGDACSSYSHIWRRPEGLYVTIGDKGQIKQVLQTWEAGLASRISVVTDGKIQTQAPSSFDSV
jgi:malate dehydrogenase (oxaloacetate-decarboxylating)(NADP+)